jgi:hypothetical protein
MQAADNERVALKFRVLKNIINNKMLKVDKVFTRPAVLGHF